MSNIVKALNEKLVDVDDNNGPQGEEAEIDLKKKSEESWYDVLHDRMIKDVKSSSTEQNRDKSNCLHFLALLKYLNLKVRPHYKSPISLWQWLNFFLTKKVKKLSYKFRFYNSPYSENVKESLAKLEQQLEQIDGFLRWIDKDSVQGIAFKILWFSLFFAAIFYAFRTMIRFSWVVFTMIVVYVKDRRVSKQRNPAQEIQEPTQS